jgi:hypothetical protein
MIQILREVAPVTTLSTIYAVGHARSHLLDTGGK